MPAFNAEEFIATAIESLLLQTHLQWHCVVVDDGSTDATARIAETYANRDSRLEVVSQLNGGRSSACNTGEQVLRNDIEYIMFLDADDVYEPPLIEKLLAYLQDKQMVAAVGCQFLRINSAGHAMDPVYMPRNYRHRTRWVPGFMGIPRDLHANEPFTPLVCFLGINGTGPWILIRREVFRSIGRFDESIKAMQDTDLFSRLALKYNVHYIPDVLYRYRLHSTNITGDDSRKDDSARKLAAKWSTFRAPNAESQRELELSRNFIWSVHDPLRNVRGSIQMLFGWRCYRSVHGILMASRVFFSGFFRLAIRWPVYLVLWHGPLLNIIRTRSHMSHATQYRCQTLPVVTDN